MKRHISALLVLAMVLSTLLPAVGDDVSGQFDTFNTIVDPALYYTLRAIEEKDPDHTFLRVEDLDMSFFGTAGSLNRVAEYIPLDDGVKMRDLLFVKGLTNALFTLDGDVTGATSLRAGLEYNAPWSWRFGVRDTAVVHRLEDDVTVDVNTASSAPYRLNWERVQADAGVSLSKEDRLGAYASFGYQKRTGGTPHTFFQLHRLNCTDCHTVNAFRGISQETTDYGAGVRGYFGPSHGIAVNARVRRSDFDSKGTVLTYNFGGPFGVAPLFSNVNSRDTWQDYQVFGGEKRLRVGAHFTSLDRKSLPGQSYTGSYVTAQAAATLSDQLTLTAVYLASREGNSVSTNLSNSRDRLYLQGAYNPMPGLNFNARVGKDDRSYRILGSAPPRMSDSFYEVSGTWRPNRQWRMYASYRADDIDRPYFLTDPSAKSVTEAQVTWSIPNWTVGTRYVGTRQSNDINAWGTDEFIAWLSAQLLDRALFNVVYSTNNLDSNAAMTYFLDDPLGSPRPLQFGFPYKAQNDSFLASLTVMLPMGDKQTLNITPMYRNATTSSNADFLSVFPEINAESRLRINQEAYGVRLDIPITKSGERLGVGWDHNRWQDQVNPANTGSFDTFMINYSKRY